MKLLASHGANPVTLTAAAGLDCATCNRQKTVPPPRPSSAPQNFAFGESLQGDVFFVMDTTGTNHPILGLIDAATHLHVARRITSKNALDMWKVFLDTWISPFGVPVELKVDADPAFRGTFGEGCGRLGIELLHVPADRHSQLGRIERHNAVLRVTLLKMISEHSVHTPEDLDTTLQAAVSAKNSLSRRAGVSPHIAAFGRMPRVPEQLLSDEHNAHLHQSLTTDQQVRRSMRLRLAAQKTFLEVQQMEAMRSAILRKQPPPSASSYTPGERIAYYRTKAMTRRGHRSKRSGYIAATFVALDSGPRGKSQNAWVLAGGRLVLVDIAQLRPAVGFENWIPTAEDAALLEEAVNAMAPGELPMDRDEPPEDMLSQPLEAGDLSMLPAPFAPAGPSMSTNSSSSSLRPDPDQYSSAAPTPRPSRAPAPSTSTVPASSAAAAASSR
eukprot:3425159-Amphidinium_carterae.1